MTWDPLTTFLAAVAVLAVAAVLQLLRTVTGRDAQLLSIRQDLDALRGERDEARHQGREARKSADALSGDIKELRKELKDAKQRAFKAGEKAKQTGVQTSASDDGWTSHKERRLQEIEAAYQEAQGALASLRAELDATRRSRAEMAAGEDADAARIRATATAADGARVRDLSDRLARLEEKLQRTQDALDEERSSSRNRDRDLIEARKLAVQHERSFQVVRGQLDIARERLASGGLAAREASEGP